MLLAEHFFFFYCLVPQLIIFLLSDEKRGLLAQLV